MQSTSSSSGSAGSIAATTWQHNRLFPPFRGTFAADGDGDSVVNPDDLPLPADSLIFGGLTPALAQLLPESDTRREVHRRALTAAGYHARAAWTNFTAIRFVLAFVSLVIIGSCLLIAPPQLEIPLLIAVVVAPVLAWALPKLIVTAQAADRRIDIERGLPDALDILNMSVSQGMTVQQCLSRISREIAVAHPALAEELNIVDHQTRLGSLSQALRNLSDRIESPELTSLTSLLIQADQTGTSISDALRDYSSGMRDTLRERADARANAASFWMLIPVTLCLMPSVFLFLLGPAIVQLDQFFGTQAAQLAEERDDALDTLQRQPRTVDRSF